MGRSYAFLDVGRWGLEPKTWRWGIACFAPCPPRCCSASILPIGFAPSPPPPCSFCGSHGCDGEERGWIAGAWRVRALDDGTLYGDGRVSDLRRSVAVCLTKGVRKSPPFSFRERRRWERRGLARSIVVG